jgi:hypothetical protein
MNKIVFIRIEPSIFWAEIRIKLDKVLCMKNCTTSAITIGTRSKYNKGFRFISV